jgi:lambda repressor-like predicted transcriptional regulator
MTTKNYPTEITDEVANIAKQLTIEFNKCGSNLRTIAKFSSLSVNSVKAVLSGKTANIASYSLIAKAMGTTLVNVIHAMRTAELKDAEVQKTQAQTI